MRRDILNIILLQTVLIFSLEANDINISLMNSSSLANNILKKSYQYIGSLDKFSFEATLTNEDIYGDEMVIELKHYITAHVDRPYNIKIDMYGDTKNRVYYLNRDIFTIYDRDLQLYSTIKVPEMIDKSLDFIYEKYRVETPLANILYSDIATRIMPKVNGNYFGTDVVDGILCHYLGFSDNNKSYQVWIEKGDRPLIIKFVIIDKSTPLRLHSTSRIKWRIENDFSNEIFKFNPTKNIHQISSIISQGGKI